MTPSELLTYARACIRARLPVLITSSPGVGKSTILSAAAAAEDHDLVISHPAVDDPTDAKGLPWFEKGKAIFAPIGQVARVLSSKRPTVWLLDDFGQAMAAVQAAYMQWLLARECNGQRLPDHVTIVAATNRRTDRSGVTGILEAVKSRFTGGIVELTADVADWCTWAIGADIGPYGIAFVRLRPDLLNAFQPSADLTNSPTPRSWAAAFNLERLQLPANIEREAMIGIVGEGAAVEYLAFRSMARDLPSIDTILLNPETALIPEKPAALYAVSTALATKTNPQTIGRVMRYAERMIDVGFAEFGVLLLRDAQRREPKIAQTPEFVRAMCGPIGELVTGQASN